MDIREDETVGKLRRAILENIEEVSKLSWRESSVYLIFGGTSQEDSVPVVEAMRNAWRNDSGKVRVKICDSGPRESSPRRDRSR